MRDFTYSVYETLLKCYLEHGYLLLSYEDVLAKKESLSKVVILRHDVDKSPKNSLKTAEIEHNLGARGTYYFRIVPESLDVDILTRIANLGHEIGYHYEDLTLCKGKMEEAIKHFETGLNKIKAHYPVKTVCMHGSPLSKWDNKWLWKKYNYRDFGVIAEPYFDLDFNTFFYLTDTGRQWNADSVSMRDHVNTSFDLKIKSTFDVMTTIRRNNFPDYAMQNIHPQRWNDGYPQWFAEIVVQNIKNVAKMALKRLRK